MLQLLFSGQNDGRMSLSVCHDEQEFIGDNLIATNKMHHTVALSCNMSHVELFFL